MNSGECFGNTLKSLVIVGHGPSLGGQRLGDRIDACDAVCRLKYGHLETQVHPEDYGRRTDYLCSTLKTWRGYWTMRLKEYWGYQNFPGQDASLDKIRGHFGKTPVRLESEAIQHWLAVYRGMADVRVTHESADGTHAKEGDEPCFSTGFGAIVIAAAGIKPGAIFLAGFDNLMSGSREGFKSVFRADDHSYPRHNWTVEHDMLPMVAKHYGITICQLP